VYKASVVHTRELHTGQRDSGHGTASAGEAPEPERRQALILDALLRPGGTITVIEAITRGPSPP